MLKEVDVLKISEEELQFLTGSEDIEIIKKWIAEYNLTLVFLTKGEQGSMIFTRDGSASIEAYKVDAVDTTGAGDAYVSAILYCLNDRDEDLTSITLEEGMEIVRFASISGGLAASKKGAMTALPTLEKIQSLREL